MKTPNLTAAIPIRIDAATAANVESIIASGMAADRSAALRVAAAIVARLLDGEPGIWVIVGPDGIKADRVFATKTTALRWLADCGAVEVDGEWTELDDEGEPATWYSVGCIIPR